jgi:hypothetical protein
MLDYVASSTIGFWALALLIALIDSAVLLKAGEFTFRLGAGDRIELRLPRSPYLVRNHELAFVLVSHFLRPFHLCSIDAKFALQGDKLIELQRLDAIQRGLSSFAVAGFVLTAIVGPMVSAVWSVGLALVCVVPILYANSVAALAYIVGRRADLGLTAPDLSRFGFELLACPVLTINVVKRMTMRRKLVLNVWELVDEEPDLRDRINANLELFDTPLPAR